MKYRAVIADDEKNIVQLIVKLGRWEELDIEIVGLCENGLEAFQKIVETKPDFVLSDIKMPLYDGIQLIEKVREKGCNSLFVLLSGYKHFEYARNAISLGVMDYLLKPVDEIQLNETLKKVCKRIDELRESRQKIEAYDTQNEQDQMEKFWDVLIHGEKTGGTEYFHFAEDCNRVYGTSFSKPCYQVISMTTALNAMLEHDNSMLSDKVRSFVNIGFGGLGRVYYHSSYLGHLILINFEEDKKEALQKAVSVFFYQMRDLRNIYGEFRLNIGCSQIKYRLQDIREAFAEANSAEWGRLNFVGSCIIEYRQIAYLAGFSREDVVSSEELKQIQDCIRYLKREELGQIFRNIYLRTAMLNNSSPVDMLKCFWSILHELLEVYEEKNTMEEKCYYAYLEARNFQEIFKKLYMLLDELLQEEQQKMKEKYGMIMRQAITYIKSHYMDQISLDDAAKAAGVSPGYLSKLFKKEFDTGFSEYLTEVRMDEAMRLLSDTNLSVKEITTRVGYLNEKYFFRLFKKRTGIRPADYRRIYG